MLKQIKTKILSLISSRGIKRSLFFGGVVFIIMHFGFDTVFAAGTTLGDDMKLSGDSKELVNSILGAVQFLAGAAAGLLGALTGVISILLDPGITNGTVFNISVYIKQVWVFVSNLVYLIFAGILIVISFANIVGKGDGDLFELKKSLPKFVVGILIVPFSWWIVQFMVSLSSILMVSVYTWPIETFTANATDTSMNKLMTKKVEWCQDWVINLQGTTGSGFIECTTDPVPTPTIEEILLMKNGDNYTIGGVLAIYTFGVMDVRHTTQVVETQLKVLTTLGSLTAKVIFDVIFILMYTLILVALFLILFVRVIMLWLFMMISPIFGLAYFLGGKGGKIGESLNKLNFSKFLELAMVPVYVAAALSFGLMFTFIIGAGFNSGDSNNALIKDGKISFGSATIIINGPVNGSNGQNEDEGGELAIALGGLLGSIGIIMIKLFSLAFLWIAVMSALKSASITKSFVEPIEKFGNDVGKFAMASPKYIPIPGTNMSMGGAKSFGESIMGRLKNIPDERGAKMAREKFPTLFGDENSKKALEQISTIASRNDIKNVIGKLGEDLIASNSSVRNNLADKLKEKGEVDEKLITNLRSSQTSDAVGKALHEINKKDGVVTGAPTDTLDRVNAHVGGNSSSDGANKEGAVDNSKTTVNYYLPTGVVEGKAGDKEIKKDELPTLIEALIAQQQDGAKKMSEEDFKSQIQKLIAKDGYKLANEINIDNDLINELKKGYKVQKDGKDVNEKFFEEPKKNEEQGGDKTK